jgi:membrane associated rhomboid family serine protease
VSSAGTRTSRTSRAPRGGWTLSDDEARTLVTNARRAFFVMVGVLALLWAIQVISELIVGTVDISNQHIPKLIVDYGIRPRDVPDLPYILTAPFLHFSWTHIEGNSGPLFIFGFLAAYRGLGKFALVSLFVVLTSGLAAWFFEAPGSLGAGASGVVFGYFGYIMVRGIFDRRLIDVMIGAVMALCFAYQFTVLLPHQGIGYQAHIGGLVGGVLAGWIFRDRRAVAKSRQAAKVGSASQGAPVTGASASGQVALPGNQPAKSGKSFVDPANPRADLYKQLDDLGL